MPVFGSFRMASSKACAIDPYAASRTFFLRGDGVSGAKPTTDDLGTTALTYYGDTALSNLAPLYWPDYQTTMRQTSGRVAMGTNRLELGIGGAPFSILFRFAIFGTVGPASGILLQNAVSPSSWGTGGIQNHLWWTGGADLRWQFYGSGSPTTLVMTAPSGGWGDHAFREALITFDGSTTYGYGGGTRLNSVAGSYSDVAGSNAVVGSDVSGASSLYMAFVDLTIYSTCLTTASSYTPATLPPC